MVEALLHPTLIVPCEVPLLLPSLIKPSPLRRPTVRELPSRSSVPLRLERYEMVEPSGQFLIAPKLGVRRSVPSWTSMPPVNVHEASRVSWPGDFLTMPTGLPLSKIGTEIVSSAPLSMAHWKVALAAGAGAVTEPVPVM